MTRRTLLIWLIRGMGASTAAVVGLPALATLLSPILARRRRGAAWAPVGPMGRFEIGEVGKAAIQLPQAEGFPRTVSQVGIFVWRRGEAELVVFSRNCTDLSCPVTHDPGSGWFFCPCHGGIFDEEGRPRAGPPRYPLYRYQHRVRDGVLEVDLNSVPPMT